MLNSQAFLYMFLDLKLCILEQMLEFPIVIYILCYHQNPKDGINYFCSNNIPLFDDDKHKYLRIMVVNLINMLISGVWGL